MRIALDIMGGDKAPSAIVDGLKIFLENDKDTNLLLTGPEEIILKELDLAQVTDRSRIEIRHAPDIVTMEDSPRTAYRSKKKSSIRVAVDAVKNKEADAFVTMGNTGASVFTSQLVLGALPGVKRPGLAIPFPTFTHDKPCVMIDMGASVEPKAEHLLGYGIMAYHYSKSVFGVENPRVGLMNVGEEAAKGHEVVKEAHSLLSDCGINFCGNAEGDDIFKGTFDVIVCDGFTGNVLLKSCEQLAKSILSIVKEDITSSLLNQIATWVLSPVFKSMKKKTDPSEFGGALLLGVNGICVIGHGKADGTAVFNALNVAKNNYTGKLNEHIVKELTSINSSSVG
ncbi:MAG: phosphate--acyl-ACP acyltransferase [Planctomycetota bacterium]|nr:MAG: phosphate--acyl-ACP acyltransferase [Planctomycetota bacterium]